MLPGETFESCGKLVRAEFPQPAAQRRNTRIPLTSAQIFILRIEARAHRSKFEKRERLLVTADLSCGKKIGRSFSIQMSRAISAKSGAQMISVTADTDEIEQALQIMIWRSAGEAESQSGAAKPGRQCRGIHSANGFRRMIPAYRRASDGTALGRGAPGAAC